MIFILWFLLCVCVAYGAENRNRSGLGWFVLSLIFSPIITGMFLIILGIAKDTNNK